MAIFGFSFGAKENKSQAVGTLDRTNVKRERLNIEQEGIDKIIRDVLGQADGLASIFQGEQTAGIFNTTVAAQLASDFAAQVVGEIAKLTAERETVEDITALETQRTKGKGSKTEIGFGFGSDSGGDD